MNALTVLLVVSAAAMDVWVDSPMTRVFPDSSRPKNQDGPFRLHAAAGEFESAQLCVRAGDDGLQNVRVSASPPHESIPTPTIRRVGYIRLKSPGPRPEELQPLWPDPLLEYAPFSLGPGETAAVWLTYEIPVGAKPGQYTSQITVEADQSGKKPQARKIVIGLPITVFDFAIPQLPSLRSAFTLNRKAVRDFYGVEDTALEQWKPVYDALAGYRLSFRLWDGNQGLVTYNKGKFNAQALKNHLEYAVNAACMNSIDVGGGPGGLALFPEPDKSDPSQDPLQAYLRSMAAPWVDSLPDGQQATQDPLQPYLNDLADWLEARNWLDRAYIEPVVLPDRALWQNVRDTAFRIRIHENRIPRLLAADVHPFFERYTRIWAMPLCRYDGNADQRLRTGVSLLDMKDPPAQSVKASSSGPLPQGTLQHGAYDTLCAEACDGSVFTYWISKGTPSEKKPEWLEIVFSKPITADQIRIIWKSGYEASSINVYSVYDDYPTQRLNLKWQECPANGPFAQSWALGTLPRPHVFYRLRIEFSASCNGGPVGVSEVIPGNAALDLPDRFEPVSAWFFTHEGDFPSFHADAHSAEFRMSPWVCFGQRMDGFMQGSLNDWPREWKPLAQTQPLIWEAPEGFTASNALFYPGPKAPIASIRAELLRDGMEDYEYLRLLEKALDQRKLADPQLVKMAAPQVYSAGLPLEALEAFKQTLPKKRTTLGWALSKPDKGAKSVPKGRK